MLGAIYGNIIGSLSEKKPKVKRKMGMTPADSSFLTCACKEWSQNLGYSDIQLFLKDKSNIESLEISAVDSLKKWWEQFPEESFSTSFNNWSRQTHFERGHSDNNECLIRNSPIVNSMLNKNITSFYDIFSIARLFAGVTHSNNLAIKSIYLQTEIIFSGYKKELSKEKIASIITNFDDEMFINKPLSYWIEESKKQFICDAPRSLSIALAAVMEANSYKSAMDNCIYVEGDTGAYASIAGPIAELLWGIDKNTQRMCIPLLKKFPQIKLLYNIS